MGCWKRSSTHHLDKSGPDGKLSEGRVVEDPGSMEWAKNELRRGKGYLFLEVMSLRSRWLIQGRRGSSFWTKKKPASTGMKMAQSPQPPVIFSMDSHPCWDRLYSWLDGKGAQRSRLMPGCRVNKGVKRQHAACWIHHQGCGIRQVQWSYLGPQVVPPSCLARRRQTWGETVWMTGSATPGRPWGKPWDTQNFLGGRQMKKKKIG